VDDEQLFLRLKEAKASVLEPYAGKSLHQNHGQRVEVGRRADATGRSSRRSERNGSRRLLNPRSTVRAAASCSILLLALYVMAPAAGFAQTQATPTSVQLDEEKLERDFTDPLSTLPQLILRDSYTPANYGPCTRRACPRDAETNLAIIRPIVPRVPPHTLLPFMQLVRPTFTLVTVPSSRGGTRTEFGDLPLFDIAVLPWPDRKKTGLLIGIGPTFVFPTATSKSAGQGAWQAGPALGDLLRHSRIASGIRCSESH